MRQPVPRKMDLLFGHSIPKNKESANEDKWAISEDGLVIALCDGATISFDAARWAEILVQAFIADPEVTPEWLEAARTTFASGYDREELPWHMQAALDRGSSATLLGVTLSPCGLSARIIAVGDSVVVVDHDGTWVTSYPYEETSQFEATPTLLSSNPAEGFQPDTDSPSRQPLHLGEHPGNIHILLMTDALGAWCLARREEGIARLLDMQDPGSFEVFVAEERASGSLKRDDTTLLVLGRKMS